MRILSVMLKFIASMTILAVTAITIGYVYFSRNLPQLTKLSH